MPVTAVFIIAMHFSVSIFGVTYEGYVLPDDPRFKGAFVIEADCKAKITALWAQFAGKATKPTAIICEKMEIKK